MLHMTLQGCTRPELDTWKGWQLRHHMTLQGCTRPELDTWKADNSLLSQQKRDIYEIIAPLKIICSSVHRAIWNAPKNAK